MPELRQEIARNEVHIWSIRLDRDKGVIERHHQILASDEHKRTPSGPWMLFIPSSLIQLRKFY